MYFQKKFIAKNLVDDIKLSPLLQRKKPPVLTYRQQFDRRLGIVTFLKIIFVSKKFTICKDEIKLLDLVIDLIALDKKL